MTSKHTDKGVDGKFAHAYCLCYIGDSEMCKFCGEGGLDLQVHTVIFCGVFICMKH